ncbi:MAG: 2-amino-4-hydroxy-6-hydroxymethyldihydropteridine diphosphokinase [Bacillota bacterium]|jgi:2-amino-4-hydroxy-6-hydroxymethyldihydropteridine diphosphokinase
MKGNVAYLSMGSNMGDKLAYLRKALKHLAETPLIKVTGKSSLYETDPVGYREQDFFLNGVVEIETRLTPNHLLNITQDIENRLGRERVIHWGPRTIDIDILLFNEETRIESSLILPHSQLHLRRFVLVPLIEINPNLNIPQLGQVKKLLEDCPDHGRVTLVLKPSQW